MTEKVTWAEARDSEAAKTGTRSPVALFQARELVPGDDGWASEGDTKSIHTERKGPLTGFTTVEIVSTEDGWCWAEAEDLDPLTVEELLRFGLARESWQTVCVLLNRAEGERYGDRHGHDYPDGWRIYSVPAELDLEELLAEGAGWKGFTEGENRRSESRPIVVESIEMTRARRVDNSGWPDWLNRAWNEERATLGAAYPTKAGTGDGTISLMTLEGERLVSWGDLITRGKKGDLYVQTRKEMT